MSIAPFVDFVRTWNAAPDVLRRVVENDNLELARRTRYGLRPRDENLTDGFFVFIAPLRL